MNFRFNHILLIHNSSACALTNVKYLKRSSVFYQEEEYMKYELFAQAQIQG